MTKPFQSKRCLFFMEGENTAFLETGSVVHAELIISCAKMSMNPKYSPPAQGWDADVLDLAKRIKDKKIVRDTLSYLKSYYIQEKKK